MSVLLTVLFYPLLTPRNVGREDGFSIGSLCLARAKLGLASGSGTSCRDHSLKLQACFLPALELPTKDSQEGEAHARFFSLSLCVDEETALNPGQKNK